MSSRDTIMRKRTAETRAQPPETQPADADKALLEAKPDWDRVGEVAKRLLSTPPDRQSVGKVVAPKRAKYGKAGTKGG